MCGKCDTSIYYPLEPGPRCQMATAFVRRPNETDPNIVNCCCANCGALIGASPSYALIAVMEGLHKCPEARRVNEPSSKAKARVAKLIH
jgi:hypothetical protein